MLLTTVQMEAGLLWILYMLSAWTITGIWSGNVQRWGVMIGDSQMKELVVNNTDCISSVQLEANEVEVDHKKVVKGKGIIKLGDCAKTRVEPHNTAMDEGAAQPVEEMLANALKPVHAIAEVVANALKPVDTIEETVANALKPAQDQQEAVAQSHKETALDQQQVID